MVHDYVDAAVPVLARMAAERRVGYCSLGYIIEALGRDPLTAMPGAA